MKNSKWIFLLLFIFLLNGCQKVEDNNSYSYLIINLINPMEVELDGLEFNYPANKIKYNYNNNRIQVYIKKDNFKKNFFLSVKSSNKELGKVPLFIQPDETEDITEDLRIEEMQMKKEYDIVILPEFKLTSEKKDFIFEDDFFISKFSFSYNESNDIRYIIRCVILFEIFGTSKNNFSIKELFYSKNILKRFGRSECIKITSNSVSIKPRKYYFGTTFSYRYRGKIYHKYSFTYYNIVLKEKNIFYINE